MFNRSPVRRSSREKFPSCDSAYTMLASSGSLRVWKPSPPPTLYQSLVLIPARPFSVRDGPQIDPLSCMPPQTL
jgi:hypothetical protein